MNKLSKERLNEQLQQIQNIAELTKRLSNLESIKTKIKYKSVTIQNDNKYMIENIVAQDNQLNMLVTHFAE